MSIQIPPNSKIAAYYAINIRGSKGCVLCFKNDKKEGLGVVDVPYNLIGELEEKLIEMSQ
ncbi:hypothetical protein J4437_01850 [Candidatus Woesearchaeota archaeon]|nr:hypothetical protein [Candidatus Woesearchaeota archaeon]